MTEEAVDRLLERSPLRLRFPPAIESEFERATIAARNKALRLVLAMGLSVCLLTALGHSLAGTVPLQSSAGALLFCVILPLHLLALRLIDPRWPVWVQGAAPCMAMFTALAILAHGGIVAGVGEVENTITATAAVASVLLLAAPMRFAHAAILAALTVLLIFWLPGAAPAGEPVPSSAPVFPAMLVLVALSFAFRTEANNRRSFLRDLRDRMKALQLLELSAELKALSETDQLTGISNRRHFDNALRAAWTQAAEERHWLGLMMIDIDYFKRFNDRYGHAVGDTCLQVVADTLSDELADEEAILARIGGEEFVAVLPRKAREECARLADQLRLAVAAQTVPGIDGEPEVRITISIGVASVKPDRRLPAEVLVRLADRALYRAKAGGRNAIAVERPPALGHAA